MNAAGAHTEGVHAHGRQAVRVTRLTSLRGGVHSQRDRGRKYTQLRSAAQATPRDRRAALATHMPRAVGWVSHCHSAHDSSARAMNVAASAASTSSYMLCQLVRGAAWHGVSQSVAGCCGVSRRDVRHCGYLPARLLRLSAVKATLCSPAPLAMLASAGAAPALAPVATGATAAGAAAAAAPAPNPAPAVNSGAEDDIDGAVSWSAAGGDGARKEMHSTYCCTRARMLLHSAFFSAMSAR